MRRNAPIYASNIGAGHIQTFDFPYFTKMESGTLYSDCLMYGPVFQTYWPR